MKIVQYPHPALRYKARPVTSIGKDIRLLAGHMLDLMYENRGLGLAAPQVAAPVQLLVMNFSPDATDKAYEVVAVNPVLVDRKGSQEANEGCLSFPGLYQKVRRARSVFVRAYDLDGRLYEMRCADLGARLWQHEIDHLHGELFIDKLTTLARIASRQEIQEFEDVFRKYQKSGDIPPDADLVKQLDEYGQPAVVP